jgi:RNA polymerase sigma-70 factor (ECF subfamily)
VPGLVSLLREDAVFAMPPVPSWFQGRAAIGRFLETDPRLAQLWRDGFRLMPTVANACPAFGVYRGAGGDVFLPHGIMVTSLAGGAIARVTTFLDPTLVARFDLPATV